MQAAGAIIKELKLEPHPEGGYYRQTFCDDTNNGRASSTAIYYLLKAGEVSRWHRVDAVEIWHWYGGASLELRQFDDRDHRHTMSKNQPIPKSEMLGNRFELGERPQIIVPKFVWQSAISMGDWTLVGCSVAPGFQFSGFEMAPIGWEPK